MGDLPGGNAFNGADLWVWDCNGASSQQWLWTENSFAIRPQLDPSKCVDAGNFRNGQQLFIWDCNGQPQQSISYDSANERTIYFGSSSSDASMCVEVPDGGLGHGQVAWVWECNGHANQRWEVGVMSADVLI